jgi:hypothetical protein
MTPVDDRGHFYSTVTLARALRNDGHQRRRADHPSQSIGRASHLVHDDGSANGHRAAERHGRWDQGTDIFQQRQHDPGPDEQYDAFFPAGIYFTGESYYARSALKPGPVKTVVEAFYKAANEAGLPIEESQANAWDGTMLVIDAPRHLGANATAVQMREYIAGITNYAGINGMYDFKRNPRRGIGDRDGYVMHWDSAKHDLVILSSRGGVRR